jgi:twitching motility protein PilJ
VEQTSTELLAASTEQLREIRDTGESVLQMAGRINDVSARRRKPPDWWRASRCRLPSRACARCRTPSAA